MKKFVSSVLALTVALNISGCAQSVTYSIMTGNPYALKSDVNSSNVNTPVDGMTPLVFAVSMNKPEMVKILIDKQADVNLVNPSTGMTPLVTAIVMSGPEIKKMLLQAGVDVNKPSTDATTPLQLAAGTSQTELAKTLIEKGANVNSVDLNGTTPLIMAAATANLSLARVLVARGAQINVEDKGGNSPLSLVEVDNVEFIKFLKDKGANLFYRNAAGRSIAEQRAVFAAQKKAAAAK